MIKKTEQENVILARKRHSQLCHSLWHWLSGCWHQVPDEIVKDGHTLGGMPTGHKVHVFKCCRCGAKRFVEYGPYP